MLRSLHTVSSGARHAIQPHLLSIQFLFYAVLFIKRRQSPTLRKNALSYTHPCTVSWNATEQCNAMQCNAMAQPNARKNAMSCSVPCIRCPRALAMLLECNANAMQYNTLQYNAMQCNAMQWHSPTLEKTLRHAPFLAYDVLGRSPCHPAPSFEHRVPFFTQFCL